MAGTSWDRLGQTEAAFELVAPVLRRVARAEGLKLDEFFRDDPVWRLSALIKFLEGGLPCPLVLLHP